MIDDPHSLVVELPDRKEITLCEALTAVIYGEALDVKKYQPPRRRRTSDDETSWELRKVGGQIPWVEQTPANERIVSRTDTG